MQRMVFIVEGCVERSQGFVGTSLLNSGGFFGEELLSWCLRLRHRRHFDELPTSLATFSCVQPVEAYGLDALDLKYITEHFRYKFASEKIKRTMRYYSSNWRTWGAVIIQSSWRRHRIRTRGYTTRDRTADNRLRQYAAVFLSMKPNDHLE